MTGRNGRKGACESRQARAQKFKMNALVYVGR